MAGASAPASGIQFTILPSTPVSVRATPAGSAAARILLRILAERSAGQLVADGTPPTLILGSSPEIASAGLTPPLRVESLDAEEFVVASSGQGAASSVYLIGGSPRGVIYALGKWLRLLRYRRDGSVEVPLLLLRESPFHGFRASFAATHLQDRGYWRWSEARHREHLEDLALWGANVGMILPMQFGQRSSKVWEHGTPEAKEWEPLSRFPNLARELDMTAAAYIGANDVFPEDFPSLKAAEGIDGDGTFIAMEQCHVCPTDPSSRRVILRRREELFDRLPSLDFLYVATSDYGGCGCPACRPYLTKTYLPLTRQISEALKRRHPSARIIVGTQNCTRETVVGPFAAYMRDSGKDWVDLLCYACHSNAVSLPEFLEALPPASRRVLLYPEITMLDNWGTIGAMPMVEQFAYSIRARFDIGRMCIDRGGWINDCAAQWLRPDAPVAFDPSTMSAGVEGTYSYSEGLHDDVNKAMWLSYGFSPQHRPQDVRLEYARFHFGEEAAPDAAEAMRVMEEHSLGRCAVTGMTPRLTAAGSRGEELAEREGELVQSAAARLPRWAVDSWRFDMLRYRAIIDRVAFRFSRGEECRKEREELLEIDRRVHGVGHDLIVSCKDRDPARAARELEAILMRTRQSAPGS